MTKQPHFLLVLLLCLTAIPSAWAQYPEWKHSAAFQILTTPDGANLPADVSVEDFPLLVRLNKETFDFQQAQANGEDIRFSAEGKPLPFQIEQWNASQGTACLWVRIPVIRGNARQEIKLHWGKNDAASESNGQAVFNESNGYCCVFHMDSALQDETRTLTAKDKGTTEASGMIGAARHFNGKQGIFCGDKIDSFPTGSSPNTTQAWFRSEISNARILGWGNEAPQGKIILNYRSPPHVRMECYFSGADVAGKTAVQKSEWVHVVHTYQKGESLLYVNGVLDGVTKTESAPLAIKNPARMFMGGWYDVYEYVGDLDEVRLSKVVRSAEWAKLEYENQKPLQTLVGHLVQAGSEFRVAPEELKVAEGKQVQVTAQAGGAQKVYWILKRDGVENVVATDRFNFTFDAGRVAGDQKASLQFKAVYGNEVKTKDIPISIAEDLPEPIFTLQAPASWDGRETIEVAAQISNLPAMKSKDVSNLNVRWKTSGLAVIKEAAEGKLILKRSQNSGKLTVTATIDNGGKPSVKSIEIAVQEPQRDQWVERTPDKNEKPVDNQFFARNDKNEGTLHYNGVLAEPAGAVFLKLYADDQLVDRQEKKPAADNSYAFAAKLKAGLIKYKVEFGIRDGEKETVLQTVNNLVCGDAFVIEGQSNAVSTDWGPNDKTEFSSDWIRSFGSMGGDVSKGWGNAVRREGGRWEIGYWGMALANGLVESQKVPICILNGAVGGTRIDQHQRSAENPNDPQTIYGRLRTRVQQAKLTHGIRAVLWHQGEADQGADGPDGGYGCETYEDYFLDMAAAWKEDMPNIQQYYVFQIWPNACSQGGTRNSDKLRDVQRQLPRLFAHLSVMSTIGIKPEGPCHYPAAGYQEMARLMLPLVEQRTYGKVFDQPITAANLKRAYFTSEQRDEIALEFGQPVIWDDALASQFYLDGEAGKVVSGAASANVVQLKLSAQTEAQAITYITDKRWNPKTLLHGTNGIAALTFADIPIERK